MMWSKYTYQQLIIIKDYNENQKNNCSSNFSFHCVRNGSFDIIINCYPIEESDIVKALNVHVVKDGYDWKISKCEYNER